MFQWRNCVRHEVIVALVMIAACAALWFLQLGRKIEPAMDGSKERAVVLEVDNSQLMQLGSVEAGTQLLKIKILSGKYKGKQFAAANELRGQLDLDKNFVAGDKIIAAIPADFDPEKDMVYAQDYYRTNMVLLLCALFALLLLIFGGLTGFNALLSFVFSCLAVWKIVLPLCLQGANAIWICFAAVVLLSFVIIFLVAGVNRKGITALGGTICGVLGCSLLAYIFTHLFRLNGAAMNYAQALINSGYEIVSLSDIFIGAVFLASSGAIMDLAMDVSASMVEVYRENPAISRRDLLRSGLRVGRSVVGTMTTTLLLAYSGGYLTLLMSFMAQGTSLTDIINHPHVAPEIVKTLVGSFGLVLVAPATALLGALILKRKGTEHGFGAADAVASGGNDAAGKSAPLSGGVEVVTAGGGEAEPVTEQPEG